MSDTLEDLLVELIESHADRVRVLKSIDDTLVARIEHLERAVLLLARHVGAVGWNYELQKALDELRKAGWTNAADPA